MQEMETSLCNEINGQMERDRGRFIAETIDEAVGLDNDSPGTKYEKSYHTQYQCDPLQQDFFPTTGDWILNHEPEEVEPYVWTLRILDRLNNNCKQHDCALGNSTFGNAESLQNIIRRLGHGGRLSRLFFIPSAVDSPVIVVLSK